MRFVPKKLTAGVAVKLKDDLVAEKGLILVITEDEEVFTFTEEQYRLVAGSEDKKERVRSSPKQSRTVRKLVYNGGVVGGTVFDAVRIVSHLKAHDRSTVTTANVVSYLKQTGEDRAATNVSAHLHHAMTRGFLERRDGLCWELTDAGRKLLDEVEV